MVNFSAISGQSLAGKLLRWPLRLLPAGMRVPILQGRLRGYWWIVGSSDHGCWLGSYEYRKRLLFEQTIRSGSVVYDLGAHVGFYTLLASALVGARGQVFAFEPVTANLAFLKEHLRLNRVTNVTVIEKAVADRSGWVAFDEGPGRAMGHFAAQGRQQVATVTLDEMVFKYGLPVPDYLKIDVENADWPVLTGARTLLSKARPTIFLSTDRYVSGAQSCALLASLGYQLRSLDGRDSDQAEEFLAEYRG